MDPVSTLGAVAAASQLAQQTYIIAKFFTELYVKIQEAPELTRERISQLEQLVAISKLIAKTKALQTDEVQDTLKSCLQRTIELKETLEKYTGDEKRKIKRLLQSLKIAHKDDRVMVLLERIEKDKTLLALAIGQIAPAQLQSLSITVSQLNTTMGQVAIKIDDMDTNTQTLIDVTPKMAGQVQSLYNEVPTKLGNIAQQLNRMFIASPNKVGGAGPQEDSKRPCLLALDGGGVRGLSTLGILNEIMALVNGGRPMGERVRPCEIFDMVGGTSTGGLIAIMLGRLGMDIDNTIKSYKQIFEVVFKERIHPEPFEEDSVIRPIFDSGILRSAITKVVEDCGLLADAKFNDGSRRDCHTFVCATAMEIGVIERLKDYNVQGSPDSDTELTIVDAAMATMATITLFDPVEISDQMYSDGATGANNPVNEVWDEAKFLWREDGQLIDLVSCFMSIGTGDPGLSPVGKNKSEYENTLAKFAFETEEKARVFAQHNSVLLQRPEPGYYRFNVHQGLQGVGQDELENRGRVQAATKRYLSDQTQRNNVERCAVTLRGKRYVNVFSLAFRSMFMTQLFRFRYGIIIVLILSIMVGLGQIDSRGEVLQASPFDSQPKLYEVPNKLVKRFVGRQAILSRIETAIESSPTQGPTIVVIRAMGGQGKTQVALKYCRYRRDKIDVFWVDAGFEAMAKNSFAALSQPLDPSSGAILDLEMRVTIAKRALTAWDRPWLMVFDNYDKPNDYDIRDFIPDNELGTVIITSRNKDVEYLANEPNRIQLQGLERHEAVELLLMQSEAFQFDSVPSEDAYEIVERLAGHPLAISQAGAYISMRELTLQQFLVEYGQRQELILKDTTPLMSQYRKKLSETDKEVPMSVFATCELSYQQLLATNEGEIFAEILTLLAFFAPGAIDIVLFEEYCGWNSTSCVDEEESSVKTGSLDGRGNPETPNYIVADDLNICFPYSSRDPYFFRSAFNHLRKLSLVETLLQEQENGTLSISLHPLIRDWIRLRTPKNLWPRFSHATATCVFRSLVSNLSCDEVTSYNLTYDFQQRLIAHINEFTVDTEIFTPGIHPATFEITSKDRGLPSSMFGRLLYDNWQHALAEIWHRRALSYRIEQYGVESEYTLDNMNNLAATLWADGKHKEAENAWNEIVETEAKLDLRRLGLGPEDRIYLFYLSNRTSRAQRALSYMLSFARRLFNDGDYYQAEKVLTETLTRTEDKYWQSRAVRISSELALVRWKRQKSDEVIKLYTRDLGLLRAALGDKNKEVLSAMSDLARTLDSLNRRKDAALMSFECLLLKIEVYGKEHKETLMELNHLSLYFKKLGLIEEAQDMLEKAISGGQKTLPPEDKDLNSFRSNMKILQAI